MATVPSIFDSTVSGQAADFSRAVLQAATALKAQMVQSYQRQYAYFWGATSSPLTVPQRVAAMGTLAADLFTRAAALQAFLMGQDPTLNLPGTPAQWVLTFNTDGTATASAAS